MRGVLVHDDQSVAGLRHDVGFVDLRPRRAERTIEQVGGGLRLEAHVGGRAPTSKAAWPASASADAIAPPNEGAELTG